MSYIHETFHYWQTQTCSVHNKQYFKYVGILKQRSPITEDRTAITPAHQRTGIIALEIVRRMKYAQILL